jgi:stage V sporulation protein S
MDAPTKTDSVTPSRTLSVAGGSNVKSLAGSIAHTSRGAPPPTLQAVGATSLNQAIKAVAVARTYLENDDIDLEVEVSRVPDDTIRNLLQLKLSKKSRSVFASKKDEPVDLRAAGTTETAALAGAIANNVREGHRVRVTCIGPVPVFRAVDAIVKARTFLQKDSLDLVFVPMFTTIDSSSERGGVVNALQMVISSVN